MFRQENHSLIAPIFLLAALLAPLGLAAAGPSTPPLPSSGRQLQDFVPKAWEILMQAEGDLNGDGRADAVLVLRHPSEKDRSSEEEWPRPILFLLGGPEGYRLSGHSERAILCATCGGVYGDPLADLKIVKGVVIVDHYAGSRYRWGYTHRWRLQQGDWVLIGETLFSHDTFGPEAKKDDTNWLTRDRIVETTDLEGRKKVQKSKVSPTPLKKLSAFQLP